MPRIKIKFTFLFLLLLLSQIFSQGLVINEIMSSNSSAYFDEFGATPDWIEIYNGGIQPINLDGYSLSDDKDKLQKWIFPNLTINENEYLLINASGKDIRIGKSFWETVIDKGDIWKYFLGTKEPQSAWKDINFNDLSWSSGFSGFGYGDNDDLTEISNSNSIYLRKTFNISDKSIISQMLFNIDYDDGFVAYLNGVEIARSNIGSEGEFIAYNRFADNASEARLYQNQKLETFFISDFSSILMNGNNVISIQVHNVNISSSDLTAIPFLTFGYSEIPDQQYVAEELLSLLPGLHSNFSISNGNETIYLSNKSGEKVDSISVIKLETDFSYGRKPDGSNNWYVFNDPTPGSVNSTSGFNGYSDTPIVSHSGGFFPNAINLTIENPSSNGTIYFSQDGSVPDITSQIYTNPILINETKVIRTRIIEQGNLPSQILTNTYFINFETTLPIISLATAPENFFDNDSGIYVMGNNAESGIPHYGANFWEDWEKPIHFEFYEESKERVYLADGGVKIYGAWSRAHAQKSLAIFARKEYGYNEFNYRFFPNLRINQFQSILLRNSGNDWLYTMFRDALLQNLVDDTNTDNLATRPAVVFLNGEYWGIHNIREKPNEDYIASHHNINPNDVDLLEVNGGVLEGDNVNYFEMLDFLDNNDITITENYEYIKTQMDVENFIDYQLTQIFIDNRDWPGNNIKYWRDNDGNGKWRWILYDTDFGFGIYDNYGYQYNTLQYALEANGPNWPNPPWSTFLLRTLIKNSEFETDFINRFSDLVNSVFTTKNINAKIDSFKSIYQNEIPRHIARWNTFNLSEWNEHIEEMKYFGEFRTVYLRSHFINYFDLGTTSLIQINTNEPDWGFIKINKLSVAEFPWEGHYLRNVPVKIKAIPSPGYKFTRWEGDIESSEQEIEIMLGSSHNFNAVFEKSEEKLGIVINEINYNSSPQFNSEDWIEFFNPTDTTFNISNWIFSDEDELHSYTFPEETYINPGEYLVLCADTVLFTEKFPAVRNYIGNMGFGLSSAGERITLYDSNGAHVDFLTYNNKSPWPEEANGNGYTLSLKNPLLDNSQSQNWEASLGYGTPAQENDIFTNLEIEGVPIEFALDQNYPNPFNPITKITFTNPVKQRVKLEVVNLIGQTVNILLDDEIFAGFYTYDFNGSSLASGIYFYRLISLSGSITKKMILLK